MLSRLVGLRRAMSILLTNPVISAADALDMGIVTKVVPDAELAEASLAMARELAAGAPKALAATKRLVWAGTAPASSSACQKKHEPCPSCQGWPTHGRARRRHRATQTHLYRTLGVPPQAPALSGDLRPPRLRLGRGEGHWRGDRRSLPMPVPTS